MYVRKGYTKSAKALEFDGIQGRRLAFSFFTSYKEKYAIRDTSGKLVETPRRKAKVSRKPITGKHNIDQLIYKDKEEIRYLEFRLKFTKDPYMRQSYQNSIRNYQNRITQLKAQAKKLS